MAIALGVEMVTMAKHNSPDNDERVYLMSMLLPCCVRVHLIQIVVAKTRANECMCVCVCIVRKYIIRLQINARERQKSASETGQARTKAKVEIFLCIHLYAAPSHAHTQMHKQTTITLLYYYITILQLIDTIHVCCIFYHKLLKQNTSFIFIQFVLNRKTVSILRGISIWKA